MTQRTTITRLTVRSKLADPTLWYQLGQEVKLGCTNCPELHWCGGLSIQAPVFNCLDLCCGSPKTCRKYVCPNQRRYSAMVNEVGGLALRPYRQCVAPIKALPDYVPCILDIGDLAGPLSISAVAISLYEIIDRRTGLARFASRQEMLQRFKIHPRAHVIITATAEDQRVERFWHVFRSKRTAESLRRLRPALIATPNFSMHADTVRHDNLLSMARIAACFEEFAAAGLPVAVHVNGRTPHDFLRWSEYLIASPGIYAVSYEMGTIGRSAPRRAWHAKQLIALARRVGRPLTLVMRAGSSHLSELSTAFDRVIALDTTAHMKAKKRQSATRIGSQLTWEPAPTAPGKAIDDLLLHNIRVCRRATCELLLPHSYSTSVAPSSMQRPATRAVGRNGPG